MTDDIQVTSPGARRVKRRRRTHRGWWADPDWIAFRDAHARVPGAACHYCGYHHGEQRRDRQGNPRYYKTGKNKGKPMIVSLTINHEDRDAYRSKEEYLTWGPRTKISCVSCNRNWEKGLVICPICKTNFKHWSSEMCRECRDERDPIGAQIRKERQERQQQQNRQDRALRDKKYRAQLNPFPCAHRLLTGRCSKNKAGGQCTFSRQKCLRDPKLGGCPQAKERKKKEETK